MVEQYVNNRHIIIIIYLVLIIFCIIGTYSYWDDPYVYLNSIYLQLFAVKHHYG